MSDNTPQLQANPEPIAPPPAPPADSSPEPITQQPPPPAASSPEPIAPPAQPRPVSAPPIIELESAGLNFGSFAALEGLTFTLPPGIIFGLIGPSGSGKTTTVRMLAGLYKPSTGTVRVLGEEPTKFRTRTREKIGYLPQQFVLYPQLSVHENINFVASLYGMPLFGRRKRIEELLNFVELTDSSRKLGSQLSGGMQRRLAVAAALVNDPQLIFADEPTAGIDPVLRAKFWDNFRSLREHGRTLFVTTQYVGEAAYCDYVGVMRAGRLIDLDTPQNLRRKAMGGEILQLVVDVVRARDAMHALDRHPAVNEVRRAREPGHLYIFTDDASTTMPVLLTHLNNEVGITVQSMDRYELPFDDVFVHLMQRDEQNG